MRPNIHNTFLRYMLDFFSVMDRCSCGGYVSVRLVLRVFLCWGRLFIVRRMSLLKTKRERPMFASQGYLYTKDKESKRDASLTFWRCVRKNECRGRITVRDGSVENLQCVHLHEPSPAAIDGTLVSNTVKRKAVETQESPSVIVNTSITDTPSGSLSSVSSTLGLKKIVLRKRSNIKKKTPNPSSLTELHLPNDYQVYNPSPEVLEKFLLADTGLTQQRILIFGRESWLAHLSAEEWYIDGTFKIAPVLFNQVLVLMVKRFELIFPVLYALLPDKKLSTYKNFFEIVKSLHQDVAPKYLSCDFEQAIHSAAKESFPDVEINGCLFHLAQNLQKFLSRNGFKKKYADDSNFVQKVSM